MTNSPPFSKGELTQAAIRQAAYPLFITQGYHATSMRQIAAAAGIALGGIYNHFSSKEQIFAEVLDQYHPYHTILPLLLEAENGGVEEFAYEAFARVQQALQEHPELMNLAFIEMVEFRGKHLPAIFNKIAPQLAAALQRINHAHPQLRPIPVPVIMQMFIGLLLAYAINEHILSRPLLPEGSAASARAMVDIFLNGILEKE